MLRLRDKIKLKQILSLALCSFVALSTTAYAQDDKVIESTKIETLSLSSEELAEDNFDSKINTVMLDSSDSEIRYIYPVLYAVEFKDKNINVPFYVSFGSGFDEDKETSDVVYDYKENRLLRYRLNLINSKVGDKLNVSIDLTVTSFPYSEPGTSKKILQINQKFSVPITHDLESGVTNTLDSGGGQFSINLKFPPEASISRKGLLY